MLRRSLLVLLAFTGSATGCSGPSTPSGGHLAVDSVNSADGATLDIGSGADAAETAGDGVDATAVDFQTGTDAAVDAGCGNDSACKGSTPRCDLASGQCVACLAPGDCNGGKCVNHACAPCQDDGDCPGQKCSKDKGKCVACLVFGDCLDGQICEGGACLPMPGCPPGETKCLDDGTLQTCAEDGSQWDSESCEFDEICLNGACEYVVCDAGETDCESDSVVTCNAQLTDFDVTEDCAAKGQVCLDGACAICDPFDSKCTGQTAVMCSFDGSAWESEDCAVNGEMCDGGQCVPVPCKPGQSGCQGTEVVSCDAVGTGVTKVEDCAAKNQACQDGACVPQVCKPLATECNGTLIMECTAQGTGYVPYDDCALNGEVCVGGECGPPPCKPGGTGCDGDKVVQCDAGGGFAPIQDCAPQGGTCDVGTCAAKVCTAGDFVCVGNISSECNEKGTAVDADEDCTASGSTCVAGYCQ